MMSLFLLFCSCALIMLKGSKEYGSLINIPYCGVGYWLMLVVQILFTSLFIFLIYLYLKKKERVIVKTSLSESFKGSIREPNTELHKINKLL